METYSTLSGQDSFFPKPLAAPAVVPGHGVDMPSLSDLLDLQNSIATGEFDLDRAMYLIASRARTVANATGVAIGLLEEDHLVYRVGCGSAADYVGRQVMATLSISAHNRNDILRVERSASDNRIEATICRQFGANSLLMLPIYREDAVAGVLQVHFGEEHTFRNGEMGMYRMMAGLVEEAIWYAAYPESWKAIVHSPQPARYMALSELRWLVALAPVLVLAIWIAKDRPSPRLVASGLAQSSAQHQARVPSHSGSAPQTAPHRTTEATKTRGSKPRWVWVGDNELDYLAQDVTMRFFSPQPPVRRIQRGGDYVEYIGEDVTVRYFTPRKVASSPVLPHGSAVQVLRR